MPYDSNGTFNRLRSWVSDASANIKIRADYHDQHDGDLATGLSTAITKDGRTQPTADLPMNGKRLINMAQTQPSDAPTTAASKSYVDSHKDFSTGMTISGAGVPNGFINFASTTGTTGIAWMNAGMSWVGRSAETGKWRQRLAVLNDTLGAGAELVTIDIGGFINNASGYYTHNLSHDGTNWRTNKLGTGTAFLLANGSMSLYSNDVATVQDNQIATLVSYFTANQNSIIQDNTGTNGGSSFLTLKKKGTGQGCYIQAYAGTQTRWRMDMGDAVAESGTAYVGSNWNLYAWDNTGANPKLEMSINRSTNLAAFLGAVQSSVGTFQSATTTTIIAAANGGQILLRPNGAASTTEQCYISTTGDWHISSGHLYIDANTTRGAFLGMGQQGRNGYTGAYDGNWHNNIWSGGYVYCLVNTTNVGAIQMVSDYRTKRNSKPLPSMWDKVKSLSPISYNLAKFRDITEDDDEERWGFVAHDLQAKLTHHAASFDKDAKDALQSPNVMVLVAALTKALQEAMARIEALEARP